MGGHRETIKTMTQSVHQFLSLTCTPPSECRALSNELVTTGSIPCTEKGKSLVEDGPNKGHCSTNYNHHTEYI